MAGRWLRSQVGSSVRVAMTALRVGMAFGVGSLAAAAALAQQPQPAASPQHGQTLASTCLGCHGIEGYRNAYPDYAVPRLSGQHADYLQAALKEYRSDARQYPTMHLQALSLSDQDITDVATYLAGKPLVAATSSASPPQIPQPAVVCTSCHGQDGIGVSPTVSVTRRAARQLHRARAAGISDGLSQESDHERHGGFPEAGGHRHHRELLQQPEAGTPYGVPPLFQLDSLDRRKSLPAICAASPVTGIHPAAPGAARGRSLRCFRPAQALT